MESFLEWKIFWMVICPDGWGLAAHVFRSRFSRAFPPDRATGGIQSVQQRQRPAV